jgi:hypothetical protein
MARMIRLLLLTVLLAGCAASPPPDPASSREAASPGTFRMHMGGEVVTGISVSR